jgi:hypothetical protein
VRDGTPLAPPARRESAAQHAHLRIVLQHSQTCLPFQPASSGSGKAAGSAAETAMAGPTARANPAIKSLIRRAIPRQRGHDQYTRFFGLMYSTSSVSV